jgi:hypothetical protein
MGSKMANMFPTCFIQNKQNYLICLFIAMFSLVGCGTGSSNKAASAASPAVAVKDADTQLTTEFTKEGVRVFYALSGEVDRVEARGYARVWQQQYEHVAELEAKEKLTKFLRGETVSSNRKTTVIARAIERAQDNTLNRSKTLDGAIDTGADDAMAGDESSRTNTNLRKASINNAQMVSSTITVSSAGRLTAIRKKSGEMIDGGRTYMGVYVWTQREQDATRKVRNLMDQQ